MNRDKIKAKLLLMDTQVFQKMYEYLEKIILVAINYSEDKINYNDAVNNILDLFTDSLSETYLIVSQDLKTIYPMTKAFEPKDILDLTYHQDGKTLLDRIKDYLSSTKDKISLINKFSMLLENETKIIKGLVIKMKISPVASILVIECNEGECNFGCDQYAGEYPADEQIPLPPYHPNCSCSFYYIETDDIDEIEELDTEVEEIKYSKSFRTGEDISNGIK